MHQETQAVTWVAKKPLQNKYILEKTGSNGKGKPFAQLSIVEIYYKLGECQIAQDTSGSCAQWV